VSQVTSMSSSTLFVKSGAPFRVVHLSETSEKCKTRGDIRDFEFYRKQQKRKLDGVDSPQLAPMSILPDNNIQCGPTIASIEH
jgi:hypothetical protein